MMHALFSPGINCYRARLSDPRFPLVATSLSCMNKLLATAKEVIKAYREPLRTEPLRRFNFFPIAHAPLVLFTYTGWDLGNVFYMSEELAGQDALFAVGFSRYPRRWQLRYMRRQLRLYNRRYPRNKVIFLANSSEEQANMMEFGFKTYQVSNNALQREDQFELDAQAEKKYDAVMTARMAPWKRMELARKVENLALITIPDDEAYGREMRDVLSHATWANFDEAGTYHYLSREEVAEVVNSARVGLILSAFEGNNRASIEYLMCGIAVVSTPSKGGRDMFFDEDYCRIVDANPAAVRAGVQDLVRRSISPEEIRSRTLEKINEHRARFLAAISECTAGQVSIDPDRWLDLFPDNMDFRCKPVHFRKFLESDFFRSVPPVKSEKRLRKDHPDLWADIVA